MSKKEYITEQYVKSVSEEEEQNENEFYAEEYAGDLKMQSMDSEQEIKKEIVVLAVETAKRLKPYIISIEDLALELDKLNNIRQMVEQYDSPVAITDAVTNILRIIDNTTEGIKGDMSIKNFEIAQIVGVEQ